MVLMLIISRKLVEFSKEGLKLIAGSRYSEDHHRRKKPIKAQIHQGDLGFFQKSPPGSMRALRSGLEKGFQKGCQKVFTCRQLIKTDGFYMDFSRGLRLRGSGLYHTQHLAPGQPGRAV